MKSKFTRFIAISMVLVLLLGTVTAFAASSYGTYIYAKDGFSTTSPDAYTPTLLIDSAYMGLVEATEKKLTSPSDIEVDENDHVYIADADNDRIVVLDEYYKFKFTIDKFINGNGIPDALDNPQGLFVGNGKIYVADTDNKRIAIFNQEDGSFYTIVEQPEDEVFPEGSVYRPIAVAVDKSGRMYIVSSSTYMGVIAMNEQSEFQGFIGAQKVTISTMDIIWRYFQTKEQRARSEQYISTNFNNIDIDDRGFIYVTSDQIAESSQQAAVKSKGSTYSPVKKLNTAGDDIMKRNGFFGFGEVSTLTKTTSQMPNQGTTVSSTSTITGVSQITDVALGEEGTWSIIDAKRQKVLTYDENGSLLFIFGDQGSQLGNLKGIKALCYQGSRLLLLDKSTASISVYTRTEYGDILIGALRNQNNRNYDKAKEDWENILQRNNNFDAAYIGIGKALHRSGDWEGAMEYYKNAYDTENYSNSFKMFRKEWVSKYILLVPVVIIIVCVALTKFFGYAAKVNSKVAVSGKKKTLWHEFIYGFHVIFHPFDGFWDLKHEKRGSMRAALIYIVLAILTFTYQSVGKGYAFNPYNNYISIFAQILSVLVPVFLWVLANWCFTTLFEGEGSLKDIFIATAYATLPLTLLLVPSVICTYFLTTSEASVVNLLESVAWIWVGLLVFFGSQVTHDYTLIKNVAMCLCTIVGMVFLMFVAILFSSMLVNVVNFVTSIVTEISYRM